jgi:transposase
MLRMPSAVATAIDLTSLPTEVVALIERLQQQAKADAQELARRGGELTLAQAKIDKLNFELARLRRWQFDAKTEAMTAAQRLLFAEALAEAEASLRAKLAELQRGLPEAPKTPKAPPRKPRRQALPAHLERVEHRHEPEDTHCTTPQCGQPMTRVGEDVSERLDIVPAEFFVHRHIYGKWACRCCQVLRQAPSVAEVIEGGIAASGFVAHTLISRFVDHMPYYRQETVNARSGVHTPRSTLASIAGQAGAALEPLHDALRRFIQLRGAARRRDPGGLAGPGRGQDAQSLRLGLRQKLA